MSWADGYYRSRLTARDQLIYDAVLSGWNDCRTAIPMPPGLGRSCDTNPIVESVARDHPEIFWIDYYAYSLRSVHALLLGVRSTLHFGSFYAPGETRRLQQQVMAWRDRVLSQVDPRLPQRDRLWLLYDYLARQVTYGEQGSARSHTLIGCVLPGQRVLVCEGIAKAFKFLCDSAGIPCIIVSGMAPASGGKPAERHAWNLVQLGGTYRHLDVTAELTQAHSRGMASRVDYLCKDDELSRRGYRWDAGMVPQCR